MKRAGGVVGAALIWLGPICLLAGFALFYTNHRDAAARVFGVGLVFFFLAPLGSKLTQGTKFSSEAAVERRRVRAEQATEHASTKAVAPDFGWALLALIGFLWLAAGTLIAFNRVLPSIWRGFVDDYNNPGVRWWAVLMLAFNALLQLLIVVLGIALPSTLMAGCWRRTKWGTDAGSFAREEERLSAQQTTSPHAELAKKWANRFSVTSIALVLAVLFALLAVLHR
jgi:hypothetical protein